MEFRIISPFSLFSTAIFIVYNAFLVMSDKICVVNITNNNNVGHIYGNVLPAVLAPPYCNNFLGEKVRGTPLLRIMDQLGLTYSLLNSINSSSQYTFRSGSGFSYIEGFAELKSKIAKYTALSCKCEMGMYNVTVFNRKTRGLHNYPRLLRSLEDRGWGPIRYYDSSREENQCWYYCLYTTSRVVISVYGAESIYPFLLNTSFISVAYEGLSDQFLFKIRRSYYSTQHPKMKVALVKASIVEEYYSKICVNFWKNYSTYIRSRQSKTKPSPFLHKCISLYLHPDVVNQIVDYASVVLSQPRILNTP